MNSYLHYLTRPSYTHLSYYSEYLEFWTPLNDDFEVDLSRCSQAGDVITENDVDKLLWYYDKDSKQLYIPTQNAARILIYKYNNDPENTSLEPFFPAQDTAKLWLRCLGFCGAHVSSGTKSIYSRVIGAENVRIPAKVQHCHVFDLSISSEQRDENRPTSAEIEAMSQHFSSLFALPSNWKIRREVKIDLENSQYPEQPPKILTAKQAYARQQQIKRLRTQYKDNSVEFHHYLALYDKGIRRTSSGAHTTYSRAQVAKRTHTRLVELLQSIGGVQHTDATTLPQTLALTALPTLTKSEFYDQRGFGALSSTWREHAATLPGANYPIAFVWNARRVHVEGTDLPPQVEIISVAVALAWLQHPDRLPTYAQACSYDGQRDIPLAMQATNGYHRVAVFTNPVHKTARAKPRQRRQNQEIAMMKAEIARLSSMLEEYKKS